MDQSLVYKYLAGEASENEVRMLFDWIDQSPENRVLFFEYKKVWALTAHSKEETKAAWETVERLTIAKSGKRRILLELSKYAAIAVIVFSLGYLSGNLIGIQSTDRLIYTSNIEFEVPLGQMSVVSLPDGTKVHLNSGSKLVYGSDFSSGNRIVNLEGEAFFDVFPDKKNSFVVRTPGEISLKVYGTSFNISAYPDDENISTTLVDGSLGILDKKGDELTRLVPGENADFSNTEKKVIVNKVKTDLYTSWKDGTITFRNESLKEIAQKIERWFNVVVIIQNSELENVNYNGTILKNKPIDQILEVLRLTSSLNYQIVPRADKPTLIYWN